jgi:hypothetical protein
VKELEADTEQVTLRLPKKLLALIEAERRFPHTDVPGETSSRTDVMRLAMAKGLEALKAERAARS